MGGPGREEDDAVAAARRDVGDVPDGGGVEPTTPGPSLAPPPSNLKGGRGGGTSPVEKATGQVGGRLPPLPSREVEGGVSGLEASYGLTSSGFFGALHSPGGVPHPQGGPQPQGPGEEADVVVGRGLPPPLPISEDPAALACIHESVNKQKRRNVQTRLWSSVSVHGECASGTPLPEGVPWAFSKSLVAPHAPRFCGGGGPGDDEVVRGVGVRGQDAVPRPRAPEVLGV